MIQIIDNLQSDKGQTHWKNLQISDIPTKFTFKRERMFLQIPRWRQKRTLSEHTYHIAYPNYLIHDAFSVHRISKDFLSSQSILWSVLARIIKCIKIFIFHKKQWKYLNDETIEIDICTMGKWQAELILKLCECTGKISRTYSHSITKRDIRKTCTSESFSFRHKSSVCYFPG